MPVQCFIDSDAAAPQLPGHTLHQAGHGVHAEDNTESALVLISATPPDIVLLEWTCRISPAGH
jgi:DNA-binding response OmpR family regulator